MPYRNKTVRLIESRLTSRVCEAADYSMVSPEAALRCFEALEMRDAPREEFCVLLLNAKHRTIGVEMVSRGTTSTSLVHPREIFGAAIRLGGSAIIVAHNHPSGDKEPSMEDIQVTQRLCQAGKLLGIPVLDHLILADNGHTSLRELGKLD